MPRSEKDNEEIRATRRQEILAAATAVFARKGIARTKVTEIAAAANLSHGLLYHYFSSKEAVFEAIVDRLMERAKADLDHAQGRAIDRLRQSITASRERLTDDMLDETRVVTIAFMLGDTVSESLRTRLATHLEALLTQTREVIAQAQADGDLDDAISPDELAKILFFLFRGMAIRDPELRMPLPDPDALLELFLPAARASGQEDPSR